MVILKKKFSNFVHSNLSVSHYLHNGTKLWIMFSNFAWFHKYISYPYLCQNKSIVLNFHLNGNEFCCDTKDCKQKSILF